MRYATRSYTEIENADFQSRQSAVLNLKIHRLMGQIDGYTAPPTTTQLGDHQMAQAELQKGIAEIDKLWDELPKLNKLMSDAGIQYFTENQNVPPPARRRGGGNWPQERTFRSASRC
jgi:hypothetical protein